MAEHTYNVVQDNEYRKDRFSEKNIVITIAA